MLGSLIVNAFFIALLFDLVFVESVATGCLLGVVSHITCINKSNSYT